MDEETLKRIEAAVRRYDDWLSEGTADLFAEEFQVLALIAEVRRLRAALVDVATLVNGCHGPPVGAVATPAVEALGWVVAEDNNHYAPPGE